MLPTVAPVKPGSVAVMLSPLLIAAVFVKPTVIAVAAFNNVEE